MNNTKDIIVNNKVLGYKTMAFIGIYLEKASNNPDVVKELKKIPILHRSKTKVVVRTTNQNVEWELDPKKTSWICETG